MEGVTPDLDDDGEPGFRRDGHSKGHPPDLPQIVIGLAVTAERIPVRVWCWPGNASDVSVLPEVRDAMGDWKLGRVVTVVDRGVLFRREPGPPTPRRRALDRW